MTQADEVELRNVRDKLQAVELEYVKAMRARGFDPAQDENLALPSSLAKLYSEREELREKLASLVARDDTG